MDKDKESKNKDISIKEGDFFENVFGNVIQGNSNQINVYIDKIKYSRKFWIVSITTLGILTFPAYYPIVRSWFTRNSKIEITNYEGAKNDKISLIVKNSGRKPGSIGSAWLIVDDLLKTPIRFPFDNGNSINNADLFLKSGEERRIILSRPENWQDVFDTSHIAEVINESVIPCIDYPNSCQQDELKFSCTLNIVVNQTGKAESVTKDIPQSWQCLQAIGIFVDVWKN